LGYVEAMKRGLKLRIWPAYCKGEPTKLDMTMAAKAKANIKRINKKDTESIMDGVEMAQSQSQYNIYTDNQGRS
jgi:hypothetical protein